MPRPPDRRRPRDHHGIVAHLRLLIPALAAGAIAALSLVGHPGADYRHSDFFQFWAAPRLVLEGSDPYDPVAWSAIYAREASAPVATPPPPGRHIYPPWSTVALLPLGALPLDVAAASWLVAQVGVVVVALLAFARLLRAERREIVLLLGLAAAFQPLWLIVGGGNVTGFMLGALVLGTVVSARGAPVWGGAGLGLLAMKPHPFVIAVPGVLAAVRSNARAALAGGAAAAGVLLVAITAPFGLGWIGEWLAAATDLQGTTGSNATVWTLGRVLPGGPAIAPLVAILSVAALVWWARGARPDPATLVAAAAAISIFVSPHGWSYDQVVLLLPLAVVLRESAALAERRRTVALLLTAAVAVVAPWSLYALALARGGEEWSALTPIAFFLLLVGVRAWARR